jgi:hypothetical protein
MTIRPNADLGRRAETHLATITAAGNFVLFHASHRKLGMSDRNRDNLFAEIVDGLFPAHVYEIRPPKTMSAAGQQNSDKEITI